MSSELRVTWTVDPEKASREDAKEILEQIDQQVKKQTGTGIDVYEGEQLSEAEAGQLLIEFAIDVAKLGIAQAIVQELNNRRETKTAEARGTQIDADADGDVNIYINEDTDDETESDT